MNIRKITFATGAAVLAIGVATASVPALAQTTAAQDATSDEDKDVIVVTGTLLRRTDTETPSPVTVLTSESLAAAGITSAADAVRSISADSAGSIGTGFQTGFSAGGSAVSLRGLGVSSTLVLIDGLRSTNFPLNDDGHNAYVDLNSIPFSIVERVEVLKDGASATYGADAIGGVVNIIMKKHITGFDALVEGGVSQRGDASHQRAHLTYGFGDYEDAGWNVYFNAEYQRDGRVTNHDRGFPFNNRDLTSIGGNDNNADDHSMTVNVPTAYVTRVSQGDLNNPLSGKVGAPFANQYFALGLQNCARETFTASNGIGCKYNQNDLYRHLAPLQERYSLNGRASLRLGDSVEAYVTASFSRSDVSIKGFPAAIRATQPFGAAPSVASSNPGIVLPVYICAAGVNCATAADRQLNPNNPFASAYAADPANGAARIYYAFGDIPAGSDRRNDVYRFTGGFNGEFSGGLRWRVEGVYARDNLRLTQHGLLNIAGLMKAINTGAYNFVNPQSNSAAVREAIAPDKTTPSKSEMYGLDASIAKDLFELPGGPLQIAVGGQIRREMLENNNQNKALDTYGLTTASAFGKHTVKAAYFEIDAPVIDMLDLTASGRYDDYSEGFSHFSPKFGFKFTPIQQIAFRGTYSEGFRAPTFAESGPLSQYAGFVTTTPPCNFILAHGGSGNLTSCSANNNQYNNPYSLGRGNAGNPDLKPEISRSFTAGLIAQPMPWLSLTVDYYNIKKKNLIVSGPDVGKAVNAYFAAANLSAARAAVEAVGPGYSVHTVDAADPLYPDLLPRVLIINVPYVNANSFKTEGVDFSATARAPIGDNINFTSRIEVTRVLKSNLYTDTGVQRYAGTFGPYDLSSGNGTPKWRGNWQNTLEVGAVTLSLTTYYVGKIKAVATDQGNLSTDCAQSLYKAPGDGPNFEKFCWVKRFINTDLNLTTRVGDNFNFFFNVKNLFDKKAPLAAAAYASAPNYMTTWHSAGAFRRMFRAGASFQF